MFNLRVTRRINSKVANKKKSVITLSFDSGLFLRVAFPFDASKWTILKREILIFRTGPSPLLGSSRQRDVENKNKTNAHSYNVN